MNITTAKCSAAGLVVAALLLSGCGSAADASGDTVAPGAQLTSVSGGNPNEHLAHRGLQRAPLAVGNPNEHLAHRGH